MHKKKAFITGIGGQDGSYLAEHLLDNDYEVFGIIRRNSISENQWSRLDQLNNQMKFIILDHNLMLELVLISPNILFKQMQLVY